MRGRPTAAGRGSMRPRRRGRGRRRQVRPVVGLFGTHSPAPMAAVMTSCLALGTVAAVAAQRADDS
ncbi:hypothetical protein CP981_01040 [Streptomyces platensis]|uniref:Uncharacterized protein n=1 Tax=Streptomyces platensis TaxID=58346 RepID=A0AAE6NEG5_STRPT|nr:hypothetical protein CP981_01040 [Streptomyces platensis]